jgi:hypothetical protein
MTRILRIGADSASMGRDLREPAQSAVSAFYSFYIRSKSDKVKLFNRKFALMLGISTSQDDSSIDF